MSSLQKLIALERQTATIGFDWPNIEAIIDQAISECDEIRQSVKLNEGLTRLQEEVGDLIHAAISLCVFENLDVERTLTQVTNKFANRLEALQRIMAQRGYDSLRGQPFDFLLELWNEAKRAADEISELNIQIRSLEESDISQIVDAFAALGWVKPASIFEGYLQEQVQGIRLVWVAFVAGTFVGYVTLKWQSSYGPFKGNFIPEIKDLNVLPSFQKQGVGSQLMDIAEDAARDRSVKVGIGVGLSADYGQAQRLYINRGYVPDGKGITYSDLLVKPGETVCLDDDLILWLTKTLI